MSSVTLRDRLSDLGGFVRGARGGLLARVGLAGLQLAAIAWFSPGPGLPLDDAWIHQVVARTFVESGTLGYAPGQHGAAATSYLWAALLALNLKVFHIEPSRWALLLNGASALATGQLLYTLVLRARPTRPHEGASSSFSSSSPSSSSSSSSFAWGLLAFLATAFASTSANVLWFVCSGMEATPFLALSLAAIAAATSRRPRPLLAGLAAASLALLRPEAIGLGAILGLYVFVRHPRRARLRGAGAILAPWLLAVAIYVGSNLAKTGHAVPSTLAGRRWLWLGLSAGLSRFEKILAFVDEWCTRLGSYTLDTTTSVVWILLAIAAYGAVLVAVGPPSSPSEAEAEAGKDVAPTAKDEDRAPAARDGMRLVLLWALLHTSFYAVLLPTTGHGGRYQPFLPLLFTLFLPIGTAQVASELARVVDYGVGRIGFAAFAIAGLLPWGLLGLPVLGSLREANALAVAHIEGTEIATGTWVRGLPPGPIASFDIGGIGWAAGRPILDLGGLSEASTAELLLSGRLSTWLVDRRVRWVVLPLSPERVLPVFDDYRVRLELRDNPSLRLQPLRSFETPLARWTPSIKATWNAAQRQVLYEVTYTDAKGPREVPVVSADATRPIEDPARLTHRHARAAAGHSLAILDAWGLVADLRPTPAFAEGHPGSGCAIRFGWWGFAVDGCAALDPAVVRSLAYELGGRYLDAGDLDGTLRVLPYVLAEARRRGEPDFLPPLDPIKHPMPGSDRPHPGGATGSGVPIFFGVLAALALLGVAARRNLRLSRLGALARDRLGGARSGAATSAGAALALVLTAAADTSCAPRPGEAVSEAIPHGRGAVMLAIANGASVNGGRWPPIAEAAQIGDTEILALLLEHGASAEVRSGEGGALPLHLAARRGHHVAVALLVNAMTKTGPTDARPSRDPRLDAPAGPRRRSALHDAALAASPETVAVLLGAGAEPDATDAFGQTALHLAASADPLRAALVVTALLDAGADPSRADARGFTPLHAAAASDNLPVVRLLANSAPKAASAETPRKERPLDVALRYENDRAADALLGAGDARLPEGIWPPLHDAARMDDVERISTLLANGTDVERRFQGKTALEIARERGSTRAASILRERPR